MGKLRVVRAGAGSGKTYNICKVIADRVVGGLDPARILATTFTRKAAAELKGRVQARLLEEPKLSAAQRIKLAERLELAVMGTVHSVGHQLLSRYALRLGLSPDLEVLDEQASERSLHHLLAQTDPLPWQALIEQCHRFSIAHPQQLVLTLLSLKRGNQLSDENFSQQMKASAQRFCQVVTAPRGMGAAPDFDGLYALVEQALTAIDSIEDDQKNTGVAKSKLRMLVASRNQQWKDYAVAMNLTAGKKTGADGCLEPLRTAAARVRMQPRLQEEIQGFSEQLTAQVIQLSTEYSAFKEVRGWVDYTDLEVLLLELLQDPALTADLQQEFHLVMVDEFQDTNPLQLSIFQRLQEIAGESCWVGDPQQSIFGFRDADPELIRGVWNTTRPESREELKCNYRSRAGLVQLTGLLFEPLFGPQASLTPVRSGELATVERWRLQHKKRKDENMDAAMAVGIAQLIEEGTPPGDIAVLTRTNTKTKSMGEALGQLGIPSLLELPGLLSTREGALTLAGLRLVADGSDSLAAATIKHLLADPIIKTPDWLPTRLQALRMLEEQQKQTEQGADCRQGDPSKPDEWRTPWPDDSQLLKLRRIDTRTVSPAMVLQQVVTALNIPCLLKTWGDAARRNSNLDAVMTLAEEYEEDASKQGKSVTLTGFILYLEELAADERDICLPPHGLDAVTVLTYHKAKGLEWPVVVMTGLDFHRDPNLFIPTIMGGAPEKARPLEGRTLSYWSWPFGASDWGVLQTGSGLKSAAFDTPEGQAARTRSDEESQRLLYVGFTRAKDRVVLVQREGENPWLEMLPSLDQILDPNLAPGTHQLQDLPDTQYVVRHLQNDMVDDFIQPTPTSQKWLKSTPAQVQAPPADRYHSPSKQQPAPLDREMRMEEIGANTQGAMDIPQGKKDALGMAVHAYLGAIPSLQGLKATQKATVARRCLESHQLAGVMAPELLVQMGERFISWVHAKYPDARWRTEVNTSAPRKNGGQWSGIVDLLLMTPDNKAVIVDHKAILVDRREIAERTNAYAGQLAAYEEILAAQGLAVAEAWLHFPLAGVVAG